MFIPKELKEWKPEHMKRTPMRRCHWCSSGPHRMGELLIVLESPMRFHFCTDTCMQTWQEHRHDAEVVPWLRLPSGVRAEILRNRRHED